MEVKKLVTSWQLWLGVAVILAVLLVQNFSNIPALWPLAFLLLCPLMMLFMMGGHNHK